MESITLSPTLASERIDDASLREALLSRLGSHKPHLNCRIIEELGIRHGTARVDIAVLSSVLHGYEIKSDVDGLNRLDNQIKVYSEVCNRATLLVGERHFRQAQDLVPEWWGLMLGIRNLGGNVTLIDVRDARDNPEKQALAIVELLWREEALSLLETNQIADGVRSKPRAYLYERLCQEFNRNEIETLVIDTLMARSNWRSDQQRMKCDD